MVRLELQHPYETRDGSAVDNKQRAMLTELVSAIESTRGFKAEYTVSERPANVAFTKGIKHHDGALYLWIAGGAVKSDTRFPPLGRFPPIAISRGKGAVTMPSIRSYHREQLASRGLPDSPDLSEGFACAIFADHWLQKQISGEQWVHANLAQVFISDYS